MGGEPILLNVYYPIEIIQVTGVNDSTVFKKLLAIIDLLTVIDFVTTLELGKFKIMQIRGCARTCGYCEINCNIILYIILILYYIFRAFKWMNYNPPFF